jgi:hypothetical protein
VVGQGTRLFPDTGPDVGPEVFDAGHHWSQRLFALGALEEVERGRREPVASLDR